MTIPSSVLQFIKFFPIVQAYANLSKDQSTKVGAVAFNPTNRVQLSAGYNGPPRGVQDDVEERHQKPEKYFWFSHAEENLVAQAACTGVSLKGSVVLLTPLFPCTTCARMMIQAGVIHIIAFTPEGEAPNPKWADEWTRSKIMFQEAGVGFSILSIPKAPSNEPIDYP